MPITKIDKIPMAACAKPGDMEFQRAKYFCEKAIEYLNKVIIDLKKKEFNKDLFIKYFLIDDLESQGESTLSTVLLNLRATRCPKCFLYSGNCKYT